MLWMETYFFYCSVRLGVIVVAIFTFFQMLVPTVLLMVLGIEIMDPVVNLFKSDDHYQNSFLVGKIINWIENHPNDFVLIFSIYFFSHMATCGLAIYGSFRLLKWFLAPFIVSELIRVIYCLTWHIVLMIILKKVINLGVLIAFTLLGGFIILFLAYNWAASVALFQIFSLVNSERYRRLYGDDPIHPYILPSGNNVEGYQNVYGAIENIRVLVTPNYNDIDELKQKQTKSKSPQEIIKVIPISKKRANYEGLPIISNLQRAKLNQVSRQDQHPSEYQQNNYAEDYNSSVNYNFWQWNELGGKPAKRSVITDS
ncbi:uncharacterized protein LOC119687021 [Teleopsis dalmanni]|uniref:uncharacterized protein LOC119687021 n=1 Tax=Teleopsis dalmanni TaxID=139649 RepID=UPI0018CEADC7|nr:uncharacterized protein LOC119687021 [Teleopsis dalmanni]